MRRWLRSAVVLILVPVASFSTTAEDLSGRIRVDGDLADYTADEWVLDATSARPERPLDSQWGPDNEIHRVALSWDRNFLYIAIDCTVFDSGVMTWVELADGGVRNFEGAGLFRRAITTRGLAPNILARADAGGSVDIARARASAVLQIVDDERIARAFARAPDGAAGLELAVPWTEVPPIGPTLSLLTAITGVLGSGSGDAAPDPSVPLSSRRTSHATLDQFLRVMFDADGDRVPDVGVSPRSVTTVSPGNAAESPAAAELVLRVSEKAFAPEQNEELSFDLFNSGEDVGLFLTCRVYSVSGRRVRVLYEDAYRQIQPGSNVADPRDRWDGRDEDDAIVAGGVYIVNLSWGQSRGRTDASARVPVVIVR